MNNLRETEALSFGQICELDYHPGEITRSDYSLLPFLPKNLFQKDTFDSVFTKMVKRKRVRLLDLGCGAGAWAENQAYIPGAEVYGISAKDYRHREDRTEIKFIGYDESTGKPMFQDGNAILIGESYARSVELLDERYLVGDAHGILANLLSSRFDIIVSYQACRYFFDPVRILNHIHRLLIPNGFAFLESFRPIITNPDGSPVHPETIERYLLRRGHRVSYGHYSPDGLHEKFGLAIKKNKPQLHLPVRYAGITTTDTIPKLQTKTISYTWGG